MKRCRLMHIDMGGTQTSTDSVTPKHVVTTVPSRFFGSPGQPQTLRIVPTSMRMDMHMAGIMYGLSDLVKGTARLDKTAMAIPTAAACWPPPGLPPLTPQIELSGRVQAETVSRVNGTAPLIMGPVQTANPDFQGGESVTGLIGVNFAVTKGALRRWRFGIEGGVPIVQDLNGPQMPTDCTFTVGVQKSL